MAIKTRKAAKASAWFVYVEKRSEPGVFIYYCETTAGERGAQDAAAYLALQKGSRAYVSDQYLGGAFTMKMVAGN